MVQPGLRVCSPKSSPAVRPPSPQLLKGNVPRTAAAAVAAPIAPPRSVDGPTVFKRGSPQLLMSQERLELIRSMDDFAAEQILPILKPSTSCWQPQDFLPPSHSPEFIDQVAQLQQRCEGIPDEYFVVLVGDMITEEALPTYMAMMNTFQGVRDESGADSTPWAQWTRQWVGEENRHGDLMNKYCYLSGRVNMRAVEVTIQKLIGSGMDIRTDQNPFLGFVYTSFQERATKVSHGNTARHAVEYGDDVLGKLCGAIAADESRHEVAYTRIVDEFFRLDPNGAMLAFADMMRKQIVMPAHLMDDGQHGETNSGRNLFNDYAEVAEAMGVYNAEDYCEIMEHLVGRWDVNSRTGLSPEAEKAQDYLMRLPPRIRNLAERAAARKAKGGKSLVKFSWVFNKEMQV